MKNQYYDGTKLLSLRDIVGEVPEIYMCVSNRTAGKTTYFNRLLTRRFVKKHLTFMLLFRKVYDLDGVADAFFDPIKNFFPDYTVHEKSCMRGLYKEIYAKRLNDSAELMGYAVYLNGADNLKRRSNTFQHVGVMLMDEFILESHNYLENELSKLASVHTSISRGFGQMARRVPLYLVGNPYSMLNPYYAHFDIPTRLKTDTKYLRGNGWVFEQSINEDAKKAQLSTKFNSAFSDSGYTAYAAEGIYLDNDLSLVGRLTGRSIYQATIIYDGVEYAVRRMIDQMFMYVDKHVDATFPTRIAAITADISATNILLPQTDFVLNCWRDFFRLGLFRFQDLFCKQALLKAISY